MSASEITSLQNPKVKAALKLWDSRQRRKQGLSLIEGFRGLNRALKASFPVNSVFFCPEFFSSHGNEASLLELAETRGAALWPVSADIFQKMTRQDRPEGLLAVISPPELECSFEALEAVDFLLILEGIARPGNLGSILRSADGSGVGAVLLCEPQTDLWHPESIRASTGAAFSLLIKQATRQDILQYCQQNQIMVVAADPSAPQIYDALDYRQPVALWIGSERQGLDADSLALAHQKVQIPMGGQCDSLNVSSAGTLLMYEVMRQRLSKKE